MHEGNVRAAEVVAHLTGRLQERLGFDVADSAADFRDDDVRTVTIGVGLCLATHDVLNLVGDMRDDLNRVAQVFAAALLGDHRGIHLAGRRISGARQIHVEEALVVADIQISLRAVLRHEHLAMLEGVHRAGIDVDVGIELLHDHMQSPRSKESTQAGGGQALAQGGDDTTRHKNVLGHGMFRAHRAH